MTAEEFSLINPNTKTAPTFRTKFDAELAKKIYRHVGVMWDENRRDGNPWNLKFMLMFMMNTHSHLFENSHREGVLPLLESKMIHQFDHRWSTYESERTRDVTAIEKSDTNYETSPLFWIDKKYDRLR